MRLVFRIVLVPTLAALSLASCGSKGPLVLTPEQKQEQEAKQKRDQAPPQLPSEKSSQGGTSQPR